MKKVLAAPGYRYSQKVQRLLEGPADADLEILALLPAGERPVVVTHRAYGSVTRFYGVIDLPTDFAWAEEP